MKFEQFIKNAVPYGCTIDMGEQGKWLKSGCVYMKIPESIGTIGNVLRSDEILEFALNNLDMAEEASLTDAYLPEADSKAAQIIRVFSSAFDEKVNVKMSNKTFGMIEKKDMCLIDSSEGEFEDGIKKISALFVGKEVFDLDKFEAQGIIVNIDKLED